VPVMPSSSPPLLILIAPLRSSCALIGLERSFPSLQLSPSQQFAANYHLFCSCFSVFRHVGVFGAFGGAVVFVSLVASVCCPRAPRFSAVCCARCAVALWCGLCLLAALSLVLAFFRRSRVLCVGCLCLLVLLRRVSSVAVSWCVFRRSLARLAVVLAVGLCRALASSVWSLLCPFAVASCSVCCGLRVSARCVSSVGSVRSGVSLPLSGGGIAVRSERLLSRPLLSSLCAGWSGVAVAFVSWAGDRCGGSLGRREYCSGFGFAGSLSVLLAAAGVVEGPWRPSRVITLAS
jgi:hypothetical protein